MLADDDLDRLLATPLPTFIEERRRLADALKAAGRRDDAKAIAKINKPSVPVWVVNQLARSEESLLTRLGVLTDELREVPAPASAAAAAAGYGQLVTEHRDVLRSLRGAAERILTAAGHDAGPALLERIVHSLRAGMADPDTRAAIERGRLLREIGEVDFTSMLGGTGAPTPGSADRAPPRAHAPAATPRAPQPASPAEPVAQARARERAALQAERERTRARAAAEKELERARHQASAAHRRAVEEERALESARRVLESANRALEAARRTLDEKEERAAGARREEEIAARAVEAAEAAARALGDH